MIIFTIYLFSIFIKLLIGTIVNKYLNIKFKEILYFFVNNIYFKILYFIYLIFIFYITLFLLDFIDFSELIYNMDSNNYNKENSETYNKQEISKTKNETSQNNDINLKNEIKDANIILNNPKSEVIITYKQIRMVSETITILGGLKLGLKAAKHITSIAGKLSLTIAWAFLNHTFTILIRKGLNNYDNNDKGLKYIFDYVNSNNLNLSEYPLNLLEDVNVVIYLALVFLFIILNTFFTLVISKTDIDKYLNPNYNNIIIKFVRFIILRNMKIWENSNKFLFLYSWICLLICLLATKICLSIILQSG